MTSSIGSGVASERALSARIVSTDLKAAFAAALICFVATGSARAQYRLDSGDVVDISIFGRSELQRRATVNSEGSIALPLIGEVQVRGLQLADVRARAERIVASTAALFPGDAAAGLFDPDRSDAVDDVYMDAVAHTACPFLEMPTGR